MKTVLLLMTFIYLFQNKISKCIQCKQQSEDTVIFNNKLFNLIEDMENDKIQFGYRNEKINTFINMQMNILRKIYDINRIYYNVSYDNVSYDNVSCDNVSYSKEDIFYLDIARIMYKTKIIHYLLMKNMISANYSNYFITSISDISNTLLTTLEYECEYKCQLHN